MKFLEEKKRIPDKWFIIPIILLGLNFIYRLIDQSKIISMFPLDYTNDISSYMAQLFFLVQCGFHKFCPYWYNGFITFQLVAPGWFFFTLPIYLLTNNVQLSTYISMILIFILIFITFYFFGKLNRFSNIKILTFFLFLFANAIAIGNFIRLGRPHELLAWLNFIIIAFISLWYKNKEIKNKFYLTIIPVSFIILTHPTTAILSFIVLFSLFIVKNYKEKIKIILILILSLILTSFWWVSFLLNFKKTNAPNVLLTRTLFLFDKFWFWQNMATFIVPIIFCALFYFYWISRYKSKKELLFFSPFLIISILLFTRLIYFIPILKHVYPDSYIFALLFFSIFILFKLDINKFYLKKIISILLILIVLISIGYSILVTPFFVKHTDLERDVLELLNQTDGKFLIFNTPSSTSYPCAYYSYAPIYLNLTTSQGWHDAIVSEEYAKTYTPLPDLFKNKDCDNLIQSLNFLNTSYLITYDQDCSFLKECNLKEISRKNKVCLYEIPVIPS